MWFDAYYYPNGFTTGPDEGYTCTPAEGCGFFLYKAWGIRSAYPVGFEWYITFSELIWSEHGGPSLEDLEPIVPIDDPNEVVNHNSPTAIRLYVNGISQALSVSIITDLLGWDSPAPSSLNIGP